MKKAIILCGSGSGSALQFQFSMSSSACLSNNHKPNLHNNGLNQKWKKQQQTLHLMKINFRSHGRKYYLFNNIVLSQYCCKDSLAPTVKSGNLSSPLDRNWFLKAKGKEVASCLDGRCVFLVGMMGSGKTTVGKILSDALGYTFVDSDKYVEQTMGGTSATQIFKECGEGYFRENETEALHKLSMIPRQVVATGGGAVVRPINWRYMRHGISVFLDVPLDALARRIAAVGTDSRPLLDYDSGEGEGDAYSKAFMGLLPLSQKRYEAYANADAMVSLLNVATSLGLEDVLDITPPAIAIEVLIQINEYLRGNNGMSIRMLLD